MQFQPTFRPIVFPEGDWRHLLSGCEMPKDRLSSFRYNYLKGPRSESDADRRIDDGNCRLALQDYFLVFGDKYFSERDLLNPGAYLHTGFFLRESFSNDFFDGLPTGTVIYAERLGNKNHNATRNVQANSLDSEEYLIGLHSAIYIKTVNHEILKKLPLEISSVNEGPAIWHATSVESGTCLWSLEKFLIYYKPVAAKSFLHSPASSG